MDTLRKFILILLFVAFWLIAALDLPQVVLGTYPVFEDMWGKTPDERKQALFPADWAIAQKLAGIIPEDARVIIVSHNATGMLFCVYELLPRKMFSAILPPDFDPRADNSIGIDLEWLSQKQIDWSIVRLPPNSIQVFKMIDGKPVSVLDFRG